MEYSINALSKMAGVSTRTLRYYDEVDLLKPLRISSSKYRIYGQKEVDMLQQILFFRELGFALNEIKTIVTAADFDREAALISHLDSLTARAVQLETLIVNVTKTIVSLKGATVMTDKEKFEGFKQTLLDENERKYGTEIRKKYGEDTIAASNDKFKGMTKEQYEQSEKLSADIAENIKIAMSKDDPECAEAQIACDLHRQWLCIFWSTGLYSKERHMNLAQMYCDDERFKKHYESIAPGCAEFLRDAMAIYTRD